MQDGSLELTETGKALKVQSERPHLVSLGGSRNSTAITLLPLPEGESLASTMMTAEKHTGLILKRTLIGVRWSTYVTYRNMLQTLKIGCLSVLKLTVSNASSVLS